MRALALISGGLDSMLAARLVKEQGIEVIGIQFEIPFYVRRSKPAPAFGVEIKRIDISEEFLAVLKNPRYGFGSNMNPCIDCKILMLAKAKDLMPQLGASFLITGEVLGQRPMSQHRPALTLIPQRAGVEGLVLRPLCAQLLPETIPEKEGWIARSNMLSFNGRGRTDQMALAARFGIKEYAQPGGGCLLTDPRFAQRLKDLLVATSFDLRDVRLLKIGRHFRLSPEAKLIVGRNEGENEALAQSVSADDYRLSPDQTVAGPTGLLCGAGLDSLLMQSAQIIVRYCDNHDSSITLLVRKGAASEETTLTASAAEESVIEKSRI